VAPAAAEAASEPAPAPAPEAPQAEQPKADAFGYFFGHSSAPAEEAEKKPATDKKGAAKPVSAFDYFFGKDGKAEIPEPESPPPGE
jgi:hypothetical protein